MTGFDRSPCGECGTARQRCPDCGGHHVSVDQRGDDHDSGLGVSFRQFATTTGTSGQALRYALECWDCGWGEERTLVLQVLADDGGDDDE